MSENTLSTIFKGIVETLQVIGFIVLIVIAWRYFTGPSSSGLNVGGLKGSETDVTFTIANTSEKSGNVLVWVESDGIQKCEFIFPIDPNSKIQDVSIPCMLDTGKFAISYAWADSKKDLASVARPLKLNARTLTLP